MLRGHRMDHRNPLPDEWRTYRLIRLTGWSPDVLDAAPGDLCDWILRLDYEERLATAEAEAEAERRQQR